MEAADQVVAHALLTAVIQEPVHGGLVALGGIGLQLLAGGAEAGAAHQVADKFNIGFAITFYPLSIRGLP